ncbi:hypothetical protein F5B21DRAFT_425305 [Xylaria acuta]|nr:hypothetical protein F5B21DRAFT_425305 [Xylaria acuta]
MYSWSPEIGLTCQGMRLFQEGILERISRDNAEEEVKIVFDKLDLLAFAGKHFRSQVKEDATWNGRQIRNAFQTAIALGNYDRCKRLKENGLTEIDALTSPDPRHRTIKLTRAKFAKLRSQPESSRNTCRIFNMVRAAFLLGRTICGRTTLAHRFLSPSKESIWRPKRRVRQAEVNYREGSEP